MKLLLIDIVAEIVALTSYGTLRLFGKMNAQLTKAKDR